MLSEEKYQKSPGKNTTNKTGERLFTCAQRDGTSKVKGTLLMPS
jgi:hypothetical protein